MCQICSYLESIGKRSRNRGDTRMFCCPIHGDERPSLAVWHNPKPHWKCFSLGCDKGGDLVGLIRYAEFGSLPHGEAFKRAYERAKSFGFEAPERREWLPLLAARKNLKARHAALELATAHYAGMLEGSRRAQAALAERGLDMAFARERRLGFCPGTKESAARLCEAARGLGVYDELEALGLVYAVDRETGEIHPRRGQERMYGRIIIPNVRNGKVVWMQGRALRKNHPLRYLGLKGFREGLYGWDTLGREGPVFTAEGFFDVAPFQRAGLPGVAFLGSIDKGLEILAPRLAGREIVVARDRGAAGQEMAEKVVVRFKRLARSLKVVLPPEGCDDPNDWAVAWGLGEILAAAAAAEEVAVA